MAGRPCCHGRPQGRQPMSYARLVLRTSAAMIAFAGNSLLCRLALKHTAIDPASFTTVRLVSGALTLWLVAAMGSRARSGHGNWLSAAALLTYAAGFFLCLRKPARGHRCLAALRGRAGDDDRPRPMEGGTAAPRPTLRVGAGQRRTRRPTAAGSLCTAAAGFGLDDGRRDCLGRLLPAPGRARAIPPG